MKKFLRAGLFFVCLASQPVFAVSKAPSDVAQSVMGLIIGANLGLGTAKNITERKVWSKESLLKVAAIFCSCIVLSKMGSKWQPFKYATVFSIIALGFVSGVAREQESNKKQFNPANDYSQSFRNK